MSTLAEAINGETIRDQPSRPRIDRFVVGVAAIGALVLGGLIWQVGSPRLVWLYMIGGGLGVALYHAAFGFTAGWRNFIVHRRSRGLRAQLLLLSAASVLFIPVIAGGYANGAIAPVGGYIVLGSFLFGLGMQLGGGCGSGTLFTVGAGNRRMLITLAAFIAGSVLGTLHLPWWLDGPGLGPMDLAASLDPLGGVLLQVSVLLALAWVLSAVERDRHGHVEKLSLRPEGRWWQTLITGGWPLLWGVIALTGLGLLTLLVSGAPWGITFAFAIWGAKALDALGIDMSQFTYWSWPYPAQALEQSVLVNVTSVMALGLLFGAMIAAGLAGRFNAGSQNRLGPRNISAAVIGGLCMGYGARLAFGCNIGAFFSGIASGSLHGWIWFAFGFLGSIVGVALRPRFGMGN
ncbi:YeeE/YedE family protein [Spiribacter sp. 221]|uniref:YeeE/YedE family protein n=1 Tax=Spiribacter onubensis TaxID=3122420 RepID=UPI00349F7779